MSNLMINGLDGQQLRDKMDSDHWAAKLLAEVVCSTYWGCIDVDLKALGNLDDLNWRHAVAIMSYRREPDWSDDAFHDLAEWCRERHSIPRFGRG